MILRPLEPRDKDQWAALHRAFVNFPEYPQDVARVIERTWLWLMDCEHVMEGVVAENEEGELVGYALFRACPSPHRLQDLGFVDSLFVVESARCKGIATALMQEIMGIARKRNWAVVRWMTKPSNTAACAVYERLAGPPEYVVYGVEIQEKQAT